jgi:hypothetical protein
MLASFISSCSPPNIITLENIGDEPIFLEPEAEETPEVSPSPEPSTETSPSPTPSSEVIKCKKMIYSKKKVICVKE